MPLRCREANGAEMVGKAREGGPTGLCDTMGGAPKTDGVSNLRAKQGLLGSWADTRVDV